MLNKTHPVLAHFNNSESEKINNAIRHLVENNIYRKEFIVGVLHLNLMSNGVKITYNGAIEDNEKEVNFSQVMTLLRNLYLSRKISKKIKE